MGYTTEFKGELKFTTELTGKQLLKVKSFLGEDCREKYDYNMSKLELQYDYNKIPMKRRIIRYEVERYKPLISIVKRKVELCREWLYEFDKVHLLNRNIITSPEHYINAGNTEENNSEHNTDFTP